MKEEIIQKYVDGHELRKDQWQWIVRHPQTCQNARRGNLTQEYAKQTYFTQEESLHQELRECHLPLSVA